MTRLIVIIEDDRQQAGKHDNKHDWWGAHGVPYLSRDEMINLDFGDYMRGFDDGELDPTSNISIDTKKGLGELSTNLGRGHERFKREIRRANDAGYLLVVLIETTEAESIQDVRRWTNNHCASCRHIKRDCDPREDGVCLRHGTKKPLQGETIAKQMATMELSRGVRFEFCPPADSARRICEILGVKYDND